MGFIRVGVIAGTPVDTRMGVEFLMGRGMHAQPYPVSASPKEQSKLQIISPRELSDSIRLCIRRAKGDGSNAIMVYCNSLSAAVDMDKISEDENIPIITPLNVYRKLASGYSLLGVVAANNQSCAGIEKTVQTANPECEVIGLGILPLVQAIESGRPANEIVEEFHMADMVGFYQDIGIEALILGCTHFSYIKEEMDRICNVDVIDPSDMMYEMLSDIRF